MANSLRSKIKKLRHSNNISEQMCNELLDKLDGHDRELRNKVIDEIISQLDAEVESSAKFIREYDDSIAQKAYYKGLHNALDIVMQMKAGGEE